MTNPVNPSDAARASAASDLTAGTSAKLPPHAANETPTDIPTDIPITVPDCVAALAGALRARGWQMATAESCTGGLIAAACTELAGSSDWFERGFVTYSNLAKTQLLGVPAALIAEHGAVSQAVALAMARGARAQSAADCALAVTGIAGPGGGSAEKPVGTVWLAWSGPGGESAHHACYAGDRAAVRSATVLQALQGLIDRVAGRRALSLALPRGAASTAAPVAATAPSAPSVAP